MSKHKSKEKLVRCPYCGIDKSLDDFSANKNRKCKTCQAFDRSVRREQMQAGIYKVVIPHYFDIERESRKLFYVGYSGYLAERKYAHRSMLKLGIRRGYRKNIYHMFDLLIEKFGEVEAMSMIQFEPLYLMSNEEIVMLGGKKSVRFKSRMKMLETKYFVIECLKYSKRFLAQPFFVIGNEKVPNQNSTVEEFFSTDDRFKDLPLVSPNDKTGRFTYEVLVT